MKIQKRQEWTPDLILVTRDQMKQYLLETNNDRNDVVDSLLASARAYVQQELDFVIDCTGDIIQYYDQFSTKLYLWHRYILSDEDDEENITVEYYNGSTWVEVDKTVYRVNHVAAPPYVFLVSGRSWPTLLVTDDLSVRVKFRAKTEHPAWDDFRQAVREYVAARYEQPEGSWNSGIMMNGVRRTLDAHRLHS